MFKVFINISRLLRKVYCEDRQMVCPVDSWRWVQLREGLGDQGVRLRLRIVKAEFDWFSLRKEKINEYIYINNTEETTAPKGAARST